MAADVPLLCCTHFTAVRVSAAHFWLLFLRFVRALPIYLTFRLGATLMLRFWWMVPFLLLYSFYTASWRSCYHHLCWTKSRPVYCCFMKQRYTATCSRDTTTIYPPPKILCASFPSRHLPPHPLLPLPSLQTTSNMSTVRKRATWGRLRSSTRQGELARDPATLDGGNHRRRAPETRQKTEPHTSTRTHQPRGLTRRFAQRRRRTNHHRTRGRLEASFRQPGRSATSCPPAFDRAPPPPRGISVLDRAPPPELAGLGRLCPPLGLGTRGGAGPAGARRRQTGDCTSMSVWRRYRAGEDRGARGVPGSEEGATIPRPICCVGCDGSYRGPLAFVAPAGCRIPATTTLERHLFLAHHCVHGVCTEGKLLLSVGAPGDGNGLRPRLVREVGVAASGRPFNGSALDSRGSYALCWTDESRPDPCPRQGPVDSPRRDPDPVSGGKVGTTKPG